MLFRSLSRMRKEYRDRRSATISAFRASPLASHVTFSEEGAGLHFLLRLDGAPPDDVLRRANGFYTYFAAAIAFILMLILLAAMALMKRGTNKRVYGGV